VSGFNSLMRFGNATPAERRAGNARHGEQRDGRGNGRDRGSSAEPQVRDLRRFLALSLPFPD
jgi:hypothetical protein